MAPSQALVCQHANLKLPTFDCEHCRPTVKALGCHLDNMQREEWQLGWQTPKGVDLQVIIDSDATHRHARVRALLKAH